jgi:cell division protein FtsB
MKFTRRNIVIIVGSLVLIWLLANEGFRTMIRRYWEIHRLNQELETLKKENISLRKEIYLLEGDQSYIEYIARRELGVISQGEVEFSFKSK